MSTKKTHWRKLDNPNYLGAYSLMDGATQELTVTIEKVIVEEVKTERGSDQCKVAYLKGEKPLILNVTNCKIITEMYKTPYIEDWAGQQITLYVSRIKVKGDTMDALRIRARPPVIILQELTPKHTRWIGAKTAISKGNTTIAAIKKNFKLTKANEKLLCDSK